MGMWGTATTYSVAEKSHRFCPLIRFVEIVSIVLAEVDLVDIKIGINYHVH